MKIIINAVLIFSFSFGVANAETIYAKTRSVQTPQGMKHACYKKNDKPKKSTKNKKWHLDRECCLDPYEIPNKSCYYGSKYKKLILKYNLKFNKKI
jgi:hypothetical protein